VSFDSSLVKTLKMTRRNAVKGPEVVSAQAAVVLAPQQLSDAEQTWAKTNAGFPIRTEPFSVENEA